MMKSQLFYIDNFTMVKVNLFYWWCCVCCIVLLTLWGVFFFFFFRARHDHNKIAPCGMIKGFLIELNWIAPYSACPLLGMLLILSSFLSHSFRLYVPNSSPLARAITLHALTLTFGWSMEVGRWGRRGRRGSKIRSGRKCNAEIV